MMITQTEFSRQVLKVATDVRLSVEKPFLTVRPLAVNRTEGQRPSANTVFMDDRMDNCLKVHGWATKCENVQTDGRLKIYEFIFFKANFLIFSIIFFRFVQQSTAERKRCRLLPPLINITKKVCVLKRIRSKLNTKTPS